MIRKIFHIGNRVVRNSYDVTSIPIEANGESNDTLQNTSSVSVIPCQVDYKITNDINENTNTVEKGRPINYKTDSYVGIQNEGNRKDNSGNVKAKINTRTVKKVNGILLSDTGNRLRPLNNEGFQADQSNESNVSEVESSIPVERKYNPDETRPTPPDGGWGWFVCLCALYTHGIVAGLNNTYGIFYIYMLDEFASDDKDQGFKTSFIGAIATGLLLLLSSVSSVLCDVIGIRQTCVIGAIIGGAGLIGSVFVKQLELMNLTHGVLRGIGGAFVFCPAVIILKHYFKKNIGLANGVLTFGSASFAIVMSLSLPAMIEGLTLKYTFLVFGLLFLFTGVCSMSYKPLLDLQHCAIKENRTEGTLPSRSSGFLGIKTHLFRKKPYVLWCISLAIAMSAYYIMLFHVVQHSKDVFPMSNGPLLVTFTQITSAVSRLLFGKISDVPCINIIRLEQCAIFIMGLVILGIPLAPNYWVLGSISLVFGVCDGIIWLLMGPMAMHLVDLPDVGQAIGFVYCFLSIPSICGPTIIGAMHDKLGSYTVAWYITGSMPILGSLLMFLVIKLQKSALVVKQNQRPV